MYKIPRPVGQSAIEGKLGNFGGFLLGLDCAGTVSRSGLKIFFSGDRFQQSVSMVEIYRRGTSRINSDRILGRLKRKPTIPSPNFHDLLRDRLIWRQPYTYWTAIRICKQNIKPLKSFRLSSTRNLHDSRAPHPCGKLEAFSPIFKSHET